MVFFGADQTVGVIHGVGVADQYRRHPNQAVHQCHQLRHLRHFHFGGGFGADEATDQQGNREYDVGGHTAAEYRGCNRNRHPGHAVIIAAPRCVLLAQAAEAENE